MRNIFDRILDFRSQGKGEEDIVELLLKEGYSRNYIRQAMARFRDGASEKQKALAKALLAGTGFDLQSKEELLKVIDRASRKEIRALLGYLKRTQNYERAGRNLLRLLRIGRLRLEIKP